MKFALLFLLFAFLGFLDNSYLIIEHYKNAIPPCTLHGCELVLTSKFSTIFGVPISIPGVLFYLAAIGLVVLFLDTKKRLFLQLLALLTSMALVVSVVLVGIQAFVLHAFCQYCLTAEGINGVLFGMSLAWILKFSQEKSLPN